MRRWRVAIIFLAALLHIAVIRALVSKSTVCSLVASNRSVSAPAIRELGFLRYSKQTGTGWQVTAERFEAQAGPEHPDFVLFKKEADKDLSKDSSGRKHLGYGEVTSEDCRQPLLKGSSTWAGKQERFGDRSHMQQAARQGQISRSHSRKLTHDPGGRTYHTEDLKDSLDRKPEAAAIDTGLQVKGTSEDGGVAKPFPGGTFPGRRQLTSSLLNDAYPYEASKTEGLARFPGRATLCGGMVMSVVGMFLFFHKQTCSCGHKFLVPYLNCCTQPSGSRHKCPNCKVSSHRPLRVFAYKDLEHATNKFTTKIGSGGFGEVFKGTLPSGRLIAVKRGIPTTKEGGMKEMLKEIEILSALHHRRLVKLLGYCNADSASNKVMLVYEYMPNGTLADHLYGPVSEVTVLSWSDRLRIAHDAARAVVYLHCGKSEASVKGVRDNRMSIRAETKISVIHRDLKPSNILLDAELRAKVGDFGISTVVPDDKLHLTTGVKGTRGYVDPLYHVSRQLTHKSDVYSFGIVLLELVTGRRAVDLTKAEHEWEVLPWFNSLYPTQGCEAVTDPRLRGTYCCKSVTKIIHCAILCCQRYSKNRPNMCEVLRMIEEAIDLTATCEGCNRKAAPPAQSPAPSSSWNSTPTLSWTSVSDPPRTAVEEVKRPEYRPY